MNADKLREEYQNLTMSKILNTSGGNSGIVDTYACFFRKFHCELNAIERSWCHAKNSRSHTNGTITRLRIILSQTLDTCKPDLISFL